MATEPSPQPTPAIECSALTKDYGGGDGLFDFDVRIERGEVFGLIGPNGSGKSTMIKLVMDLIRADSGTVSVFGLDARRESLEVKRRIGYIPGELVRFPGVSSRYVLNLFAGIRGGVDTRYVNELAERLQVNLSRRFEELSHGNKQKVAIIQALMHRPELYILDEPTLGLDPLMQREFRQILRDEQQRGATILLSSHVLPEVESICSRIGFLKAGRLMRAGTLHELRQFTAHQVNLVLPSAATVDTLTRLNSVRNVEVSGNRVRLEVRGDMGEFLRTVATLEPHELDSRELTLEEVFYTEF